MESRHVISSLGLMLLILWASSPVQCRVVIDSSQDALSDDVLEAEFAGDAQLKKRSAAVRGLLWPDDGVDISLDILGTECDLPCLTRDCVTSASRLLSYIDQTVDPCDDFYEYACGGWAKQQSLDPDQDVLGIAQEISDRNRVNIRDLLEDKTTSDEPSFKKQLKEFYALCMDVDTIDKRGTKPFFDAMASIGKFPALDPTWSEEDFDFDKTVLEIAKRGFMPLFSTSINRDFNDSTVRRLFISDAFLEVKSPERNDSKVMTYEKFLVDNLVLLGVDRTKAEHDMKEAVDLEVEIFKLKRTPLEKQNLSSTYNPITIFDFQDKYNWLDWLLALNDMANASTGGSVSLEADEIVNSMEPKFFEELGALLGRVSRRIQANYLLARMIPTVTDLMGKKFIELKQQYDRDIKGVEGKPRWKRCTDEATLFFPESAGRVYVDQFFSKEAKSYMLSMIDDLKGAFADLLKENTWLSDATKETANEKLEKMGQKIGYPDYILDDDRLNTIYSSIPTGRDEYMEAVVAVLVVSTGNRVNFNLLRQPADNKLWPVGTSAASANAYHTVLTNEIIFPAAFLQLPSYSPTFSSSMNYGGIGMIVGHEITHGYDTTGSRFNSIGEMKNWWTPEDFERFMARTQCFVEQYDGLKWGNYSIQGKLTLRENIADNGGLKESFRAYRNWVERRGEEEPKLPGINLSHDQIFFVSFAHVWCTKARDTAMKHAAEKGHHSPGPVRVTGAIQNSRDFAEAFSCPAGSRMNPQTKCEIW